MRDGEDEGKDAGGMKKEIYEGLKERRKNRWDGENWKERVK